MRRQVNASCRRGIVVTIPGRYDPLSLHRRNVALRAGVGSRFEPIGSAAVSASEYLMVGHKMRGERKGRFTCHRMETHFAHATRRYLRSQFKTGFPVPTSRESANMLKAIEALLLRTMNAARTKCEQVIQADRAHNINHNILPSNVIVADRLLCRGLELGQAYEELWSQLQGIPRALPVFFDALLNTAAHWSPEKLQEARDARSELRDVNARIVEAADSLAGLLRKRTDLQDGFGFTTGTHYHVCDLIEAASAGSGLFHVWLQKPLEQLRGQFDLKYWPSLPGLIEQIAVDARKAQPKALDPVTAAGTAASRSSRADFFKALFVAIQENGMRQHGPLPQGFKLTDASFAALANCALDLDGDRCVDGPYVKRLRQSIRGDEARQQPA